jgi:hypothetical protein
LSARFAHLFGVGFEDDAHLFVDAVLQGQFVREACGYARLGGLQITGGDQFGVDEVLDRAAGEIPNVFA